MDTSQLTRILDHLQRTQLREIAGTRVFATIPIAESLLNQVIRETMPPNVPVRNVSVHPEDGNRLSVRLTPRAMFVPRITLKLVIEKQPELPTSPVLVLRLATMPGLLGLAGAAFSLDKVLPPGVRMQGEVILVDVQAMARDRGLDEHLQHLRQLRITTEQGRLLLTIEAGIS